MRPALLLLGLAAVLGHTASQESRRSLTAPSEDGATAQTATPHAESFDASDLYLRHPGAPDGLVPDGASCTSSLLSDPETEGYVVQADPSLFNGQISEVFGSLTIPASINRPTNLTVCKLGTSQHWVMGPFHSTGGYDSWQFKYVMEDRLDFSDHDARLVGDWALTMRDQDNNVLGNPPIHHHHTSIGINCDDATNTSSSDPLISPFIFAQGDNGCSDELKGTACHLHQLRELGVVQPVWKKGAIGYSILNDVRPANSPTMTWWYTLNFSIVNDATVAAEQLKPLSLLELKSPSLWNSSYYTNDVIQNVESFAYYTNAWPVSGTLYTDRALTKYHTHQTMHQVSYLIAASPEEIGLSSFRSATKCDSIQTNSTGFANNLALIEHLTAYCPGCFSLTAPDSKLMCRVNASMVEYNRSMFDRNSKQDCANAHLRLEQGAHFTSLAFWAPHAVTSTGGMAAPSGVANTYPEHALWFLHYVADNSSLPSGADVRYDEMHQQFSHSDGGNSASCRFSEFTAPGAAGPPYSCSAKLKTTSRN